MDELAYDLDRHCANMGAWILRQQFYCPRENIRFFWPTRSFLAPVASQRMKCRDAHALVVVVQHIEQVGKRIGLQVAVEKSAAVKTHVRAAMLQPGPNCGERSRPELQQRLVGDCRSIGRGQHRYKVNAFV
nr:hypothetical protein [Variovorax sp. SRS16]